VTGAAGERDAAPTISVVLATDGAGPVRRPLACYRRQTAARRIEILLVAPPAACAELESAEHDGFHSLRVLAANAPFELHEARATGVRAAAAEWVFVGETHSYAEPDLVARLLAALDAAPATDRARGLIPCIFNVNPSGAVSWASFLIDYGRWGPGHDGTEAIRPPIYNALFAREPLLALGEALPRALSPHDDSVSPMSGAAGERVAVLPEARIGHLNVVRPGDFLRSKRWLGMATGDGRARRWRLSRRLAYAAAAPLIAAILFARYLRDWRIARRADVLPAATVPLLAAGALVRAAGEAVGYLGGMPREVHDRLQHLEIHKRDFVPGWES
jgi:hypothetical protein